MNLREIGKMGESAACDYLCKNGYGVLRRNVFTPFGELDIVAREGDTLVFCEVKSRRNARYGSPCEGVTRKKAARVYNSAEYFLCNAPASLAELGTRIDVIEVYFHGGQTFVQHIPNVIQDNPNYDRW